MPAARSAISSATEDVGLIAGGVAVAVDGSAVFAYEDCTLVRVTRPVR